jgi:ribosomal protein S3
LTIENKGKIYLISKTTEMMKTKKWAENANIEFSKSAYENKYKGIQLELSGRLRGAQRARKMVKKIGSLNQQSYSSKLQYSKRNIYTKWGILGLKVYLSR